MWNLSIQTDHVTEPWTPDLVVVDMKRRTCKTINFAVPGDNRIKEKEKEKEKIEKYQDLRVTEDLKCQSEDYTISSGLFRCYT